MASDLTETALRARVAQIGAAGHLPPGTHWAHTSDSCNLFSVKTDAVVLYAGPFQTPYDACAARLHSPADAFIKGTTPGTAHSFISCLCPATISSLPTFDQTGERGVWVGELQRVLRAGLGYSIVDIDGDPSTGALPQIGVYTTDTASAVARFQTGHSLPATGAVDAATWSALQSSACG